MIIEKQGKTDDGKDFGYIAGENGGYFFIHHPTLDETLESLDPDSEDPPKFSVEEAAAELESQLPVFRVIAEYEEDGTWLMDMSAEALGDTHGKKYLDAGDAEIARAELADSTDQHRYEVV